MAEATKKYLEYKQKQALWVEYFEEDHGRTPTDEDKAVDATYMAIADKTDYYRRQMAKSSSHASSGTAGRNSRAERSDARSLDERHGSGLAGFSLRVVTAPPELPPTVSAWS